MLTKRLEILFDPKEFDALKKKAIEEGKSVANLVRETMKEKIIDSSMKQKEIALKRLFSLDMETDFKEWNVEKKRVIQAGIKAIETH